MLIHNENEVYMVDRDNSVFKVSNMVFPLLEDLEKRLTNTLVDGVRDWLHGKSILFTMYNPAIFLFFFQICFCEHTGIFF